MVGMTGHREQFWSGFSKVIIDKWPPKRRAQRMPVELSVTILEMFDREQRAMDAFVDIVDLHNKLEDQSLTSGR